MSAFLLAIHPWLGYAIFAAMLVVSFLAFSRAKDAREFRPQPAVAVLVLLDIHVLLGIMLYATSGYWESRPEVAYLHPLFAIAALGVGHAAMKRARNEQMAVTANRIAGRGLLIALVLLTLAIGVASAPPFL